MAFPYSTPNYSYYPQTPYFSPQNANNVQPNISTPVMPTPPASANNGLVWVQGETGAKSYIVAPNSTILLMDSEAQQFFLKSADASGMPLPLRIFTYKEVTQPTAQNIAPEEEKTIDLDKYVTREEFDRRLAEITQKKPIQKKAEVKDDE